MHHWETSACLVWPCIRRSFVNDDNMFWYDLLDDVIEPKLVALYKVEDWIGATFQYRSPAWQWYFAPRSAPHMASAVRRCEDLAPRPLLEIVALKGFFNMGKTFLSDLAGVVGCHLPAGVDTVQSLVTMVMKILNCDSFDALHHLRHRVATNQASTSFCSELLELDDIGHVLTREDEKTMRETQRQARDDLHAARQFRAEFTKAQQEAAAARAKAKPKPKAANKKKKPVAEWRMPLASEISQDQAKKYIPPGASIWRSRYTGAWCSHLPPFPRCSRNWNKWGESESLRLNLVDLWQNYCMAEGIDEKDCPLRGVLDSVPIPKGDSASDLLGAASSSSGA